MTETKRPSESLDDCCRRYLEHVILCIDDWSEQSLIPDFPIEPQHLIGAIRESTPLLVSVLQGAACPWHDEVPEDYLRVMALFGKASS